MAELKATVCLQGKDIEVISSHIEFNRKTDNAEFNLQMQQNSD